MVHINEQELLYWLAHQDERVCLLVVEGNTDVRFWSLFVPNSQRTRTVVYPIDYIEVIGATNSARQRAIVLAHRLWQSEIRDRVRFFLDADENRLLGHRCPDNVILTDFRDLESYAYHLEPMRSMLFSFGVDPDFASDFMTSMASILRPCGGIRLFDAVEKLSLPFQATWGHRLRRQIKGDRETPKVEPRDLIRRLLQNASIPLHRLDWAERRYNEIMCDRAIIPTAELMHGKDLISAVSWRFEVGQDEAERAVLSAIADSRSRLASYPQLEAARDFVVMK